MKVAFIGMGRMGRLMASHVLDAGHELTVWNRTPGRAEALVARGASEVARIEDAVTDVDAVVLMLFDGDTVHEVLEPIGRAASEGTLVIDATTTGPDAARRLGAEAHELGLRFVDAPVMGSLAPAEAGTLGVLVGGSEADFADAFPLLELWGDRDRIRHLGPIGAGNALKTVFNLGIGIALAGLAETLKLAADLGLDRAATLDTLEAGPFGWTIKQKRAMALSGDYSSTAFSLDLLAKDLQLALDNAADELPVTAASLALAKDASSAGRGEQDYATMIGHLAD
jgi:3-hydroxyisobutyrate dehydrogenase